MQRCIIWHQGLSFKKTQSLNAQGLKIQNAELKLQELIIQHKEINDGGQERINIEISKG